MTIMFLFPGQGSQFVGMGKDFCSRWKIAEHTFDEANDVLGYDLKKRCFEGPDVQLTATQAAQPAILAASVAILRVLGESGIYPAIAAGHSVGSFSALVAAKSLSFCDALLLVRQRGQLMASVQSTGGMTAVTAANPEVLNQAIKLATSHDLDVAAHNSPTQIVIAGSLNSIAAFEQQLVSQRGLRSKRLNVSHAFHSRLMCEMYVEWVAILDRVSIKDPIIPVGLNVSGLFSTNPDQIVTDLLEQCTNTVAWKQLFDQLLVKPYKFLLECGPGHTLSSLARSWKEKPDVIACETPASTVNLCKKMGARVKL